MKHNITKEQRLNLYRKALRNIDYNISTTCGLCFLLYRTDNSDTNWRNWFLEKKGDIYDYLKMETEKGVFTKAKLEGFEEITNQVIGMIPYNDTYWFPREDWESRKLILLNAIKTLENEHTV